MKIIDFLRKLLEVLWSVPTRLFGSRNERLLKHYSGAVAQINALEPEIAKLPDAALAAKTGELKKRYSEGATLEQLLPEAFAVVREAAKRTLRMRHFDVQLVGGMGMHVDERFQRGLHYAIVDEVDSILIDEARTPLIISGQAEDRTEIYYRMNEVPPLLTRQKEERKQGEPEAPGDFFVDEKNHQIVLSEAGHEKAEQILARIGLLPEGASLYEPAYINLVHQLYAALRAHHLFHRDQHYVVQDDQVIIVDEFTGRLMQGRRWSDGLHQAVEAKESVAIQNENQTLASITFQNYFRMYRKLAGMTGTADTDAYEFQQIYGLETVVIPTHMDR